MITARTWRLATFVVAALVASCACPTSYGEIRPLRLDHGIFVGAAPESESDFCVLRALGVRRIIDLRSLKLLEFAREKRLAARHGMTYQRIAIGFIPVYPDNRTESLLTLLYTRHCGPVYVHCNLGRDRTGLVVALYRHRFLNWPADKAFACWKQMQWNDRLVHFDRYYWDSLGCKSMIESIQPPALRPAL